MATTNSYVDEIILYTVLLKYFINIFNFYTISIDDNKPILKIKIKFLVLWLCVYFLLNTIYINIFN